MPRKARVEFAGPVYHLLGAGSISYAYLPDGDVDYQAWTNNLWTKFEYDGRGMISSVLHRNTQLTQDHQDLAKREYWRDDRDRILAWTRGGLGSGPNGMEDGRGNRYAYDEEGQLTSASYRAQDPAGAATGAMRADVFEYDKMGNRMGTHNIASRGSTNFARDNNGLNQYSSWTPSAIDEDDDMGGQWGSPGHANGVTMQEGYITASFNALNQPMAMWSPVYNPNFLWFGYDPLGRCVKRWTGASNGAPVGSTTYYYYDGQDLVQEGSAMFATRIYVHGAGVDQIVASQVSSGEWRYHHYDGQGNCILLTDTSGAIREQYDYDAFGMPYVYNAGGFTLAAAAQWGNRFLFAGREWLQELRIYDYRARQYQPELGRFLQPDPKEFAAGDYNLYRYCHNDPVNKSDPTGLATDFMWDFARYGDSANTSQGTFAEFTHRAYMGDNGGSEGSNGGSGGVTVVGQFSNTGPHHPPGRGARGPSESDAPLRMLFNEPAVVEGYDRYPYYQLANKDNKPRSGGGLKFQEIATRDSERSYSLEHTTNKPAEELQRGGLFPDHVGFKDPEHRPRGTDPAGKNITNVKFRCEYPNGNPGPKISTEMQHVSSHNPGTKPTVYIRVTHP